ncbi:MAG TPA: hypothetical protein VI997_09595 [Candidatus Thermoplasmatota archaeon]|nr:hypothetical protein [Candidatus Thermoplasmatota archaeon]
MSGDAPGALPDARLRVDLRPVAGLLVPVDDEVDAYRLWQPRGRAFEATARAVDGVRVEVLDPDGVLFAWSTTFPPTARALTDVAGEWRVRLVGAPGGAYEVALGSGAVAHNDGASGRDAGPRSVSALALPKDATRIGNLSAEEADCADLWTVAVRAGDVLAVRAAWPLDRGVATAFEAPGAVYVVRADEPARANFTAKAGTDGVWRLALAHAPQDGGSCEPHGSRTRYAVETAVLASDPYPTLAASGPPPEIIAVQPGDTRAGKLNDVQGRYLVGATFTIGGAAATVRTVSADGLVAQVITPNIAPGYHDVTATRDGFTATRLDAVHILPPADVAVTDLKVLPVRAPAQQDPPAEERTVRVEVRNLASVWSERYELDVHIVPEGGAPARFLAAAQGAELGPGSVRTHSVTWPTAGYVGSFQVVASTFPNPQVWTTTGWEAYDSNAANDRREVAARVIVDAGVGVAWVGPELP